jgi:hypothetical protein
MAMLNLIESERVAVDPENKEALDQISMQTSLLQIHLNLLYKRLYSDKGPR